MVAPARVREPARKLRRSPVRPEDVLFVLPLRYEDRTRVQPIGGLQEGQRAVVEGEVLLSEVVFRRRRQLLVRLADGSGSLTLRFFYFSNAQREGLARGTLLRATGRCAADRSGRNSCIPSTAASRSTANRCRRP